LEAGIKPGHGHFERRGMNWQQFLTEKVLVEDVSPNTITISCDGKVWVSRTFDTRNDLMDLYQKVYEDEKWREFEAEVYERRFIPYFYKETKMVNNFNTWLFCLDDKDYEPHCKMVAMFYGWEEGEC
jgi:hypothetical protein